MAEYFLPDVTQLKELNCEYQMRILHQNDFADLYNGRWENAICEAKKELDVLGVGVYDNGKLIGLAGCSADCESMYQIGVDVLPEYRMQGLARELMRQYLDRAKQNGCETVILTCLDSKVDMYKKMGYQDNGLANSSWGDEEWHEMSVNLI